MKKIRLLFLFLGIRPLITDGWNFASAWCTKCGGNVIVIRHGDFRCEDCEN